MKNLGNNISIAHINLITIISGICTILSSIISLISLVANWAKISDSSWFALFGTFSCICFCVVLILRLRKYQKITVDRLSASEQFHKSTHEARDLYFEIEHMYKINQLTVQTLTRLYEHSLISILDRLCTIFKKYTTKDVCACIKLLQHEDSEEKIDINNALLKTFCRSSNSSSNRKDYEISHNIVLSENTDYIEILNDNNSKNYFYEQNLSLYDQHLQKMGRRYKNSNVDWNNYYVGTIVVPIRIETKKLCHKKNPNSYHVIGFLCLDSKSYDAFDVRYENYYTGIAKAFSDLIYILLSQYQHFLTILTSSSNKQEDFINESN